MSAGFVQSSTLGEGRLFDDALLSLDRIDRAELNTCLVAWGHRHGPIERPTFREPLDFGFYHRGRLAAVIAADTLIRPTCGLDRQHAFELSRLCAAPESGVRASEALWMWRHFAYPLIMRAWGAGWAISYQDAQQHQGHLYRYDGWLRMGFTRSGRDPRAAPGTVSVRNKVVWGWSGDHQAMAARRGVLLDVPRWAA